MRRFALPLFAVVLLTSADAPKSDLDLFRGTWKVVEVRSGFDEVERPQEKFVVFEGHNLIWKAKEGQIRTTFKIDPAAAPKTFDLQGKLWGFSTTLPGYYRLRGDVLLIRFNDGDKRPSGFPSGRRKVTETQWILTREKPGN